MFDLHDILQEYIPGIKQDLLVMCTIILTCALFSLFSSNGRFKNICPIHRMGLTLCVIETQLPIFKNELTLSHLPPPQKKSNIWVNMVNSRGLTNSWNLTI